ncbi:unnamed protein product [Timema podura]|uniref:Uncharacterized protein n=1 Tax=Timema podura TaxID=61482 RepID=A0ABN7PR69_TIMPD|nr:unnamed protein product [Timema podura]
MQVYICSH